MNASALPVADAPGRASPATTPSVPRSSGNLPIAILGVPFDHVTIADTLARIDGMIASRRPHYVVTANVDFLVQAHRDVELRRILLDADLVLCDGTPLVWASHWMGNGLPERVAGSDLAPALIQRAAEKGHRLFFLGAAPGVAAEATARLKVQYPGLQIVGHYAPPFSDLLAMNHDEIARQIRAAQPDLLLVSFGCPKQEKWIAMHYRTLGVPVAIGVGATIDFLAGRVKRAPEWMRRTGTEWLYRLMQEPRRLYKRYATDLVHFLPTFAWQYVWHGRPARGQRSAPPSPTLTSLPAWTRIDPGAQLTRDTLQHHAAFWDNLLHSPAHTLLDLSQLRHLDATGAAFLVRAKRQLQAAQRHLVLLAPNAAVRRSLRALQLLDHFTIVGDLTEAAQHAEALLAQATVQRDGTTRSLAWCGEIIAANVEDVWRMTTEHIQAFASAGATLVIVDLSRLRFIDSSGAALMLRLKQWTHAQQAEVLFAHPQPNVKNVLRLTRLDQLLLEGAQ